jgi:hypothetical protein
MQQLHADAHRPWDILAPGVTLPVDDQGRCGIASCQHAVAGVKLYVYHLFGSSIDLIAGSVHGFRDAASRHTAVTPKT